VGRSASAAANPGQESAIRLALLSWHSLAGCARQINLWVWRGVAGHGTLMTLDARPCAWAPGHAEHVPWRWLTAKNSGHGSAPSNQRGIVRAFTRYCLTLRREIVLSSGWFGSSARQMTRRSPYRQLEESGVAYS
jgi:hypothetical protein